MLPHYKEKQEKSKEIADKIAEFEARGGKVKRCEIGETAAKPLRYSRKHNKDRIL